MNGREMMVLMVLMNIIMVICDGCRHAPPATRHAARSHVGITTMGNKL